MHVTIRKSCTNRFCVLGSKMTSLATAYLVPKQQLQTRLSPSHQFIHYPFGFLASGLLEFIQFRI